MDLEVKKKETIEIRNQADALVFTLEKQLREYDAKIPDATKKKVNEKINEVKDLLKKEDASAEELKKATEALGTEAQEIGKVVYEEAQKKEQEKTDAANKGGKKDEMVVDAEVVEEEKKDE